MLGRSVLATWAEGIAPFLKIVNDSVKGSRGLLFDIDKKRPLLWRQIVTMDQVFFVHYRLAGSCINCAFRTALNASNINVLLLQALECL